MELNYGKFYAFQILNFDSTTILKKGTKSNGTTTKSYSLSRYFPKDFLFAKFPAIEAIQARIEVNLWAHSRKSCMITIVTLQDEHFRNICIPIKASNIRMQLRGERIKRIYSKKADEKEN